MTPRETVARYWALANARDWTAFGALHAMDIVYEVPQTRERVRGRANYVEFNRTWPGVWRADIKGLIADSDQAVSIIDFITESRVDTGVSHFYFDPSGLIARIVDYWPEPYTPQQRATDVIERDP